MANTLTSYSAFTTKSAALIGIPFNSMTSDETGFLSTFFSNQMSKIWDDNNWIDICPYGEARFAGNLLEYPNDLTKSSFWTLYNYTASLATITNPADGRYTVTKLLETAAGPVPHGAQQSHTFIPSIIYQYSAYLRGAGRTNIALEVYDGANTYTGFFDIAAGTISSHTNNMLQQPTITQQNNGFWLCTIYFTTAATAGTGTVGVGNSVPSFGDITKGFYSWGELLLQTQYADPTAINIPYSQLGEDVIDVVFDVWSTSPASALAPRPQGYELTPDGIQIVGPSGYWGWGVNYSAYPNGYTPCQNPFFLYYRKAIPDYSGSVYDINTAYAVDDQILFTNSKNVANYFKCLVATSAGQSPDTTPASWSLREIPAMFLSFAVYGAYSDWLRMDGQMEKAAAMDAMADDYRIQEADKMERQSGWVMPMRVQSHITSQARTW